MNKPLIVYLDSSDYSVFSDESRRTPEIIKIESQLLQLIAENKIEIRFSQVNVIEAAPTRPEDILSSSKRFQTIKKFVDPNAWLHMFFALEYETETLKKLRKESNKFNILDENGVWFHGLNLNEFSYLAENINEEISKLPNREMRRKAKKKRLNADGGVKNAKLLLKGSSESLALKMRKNYPISDEDAKRAAESYFNNGSTAIFVQSLSNSLSNLEILGKWYESDWDEAIQLSSFLREIGGDFLNSLEQLKDKLTELTNENELEGLSDYQIKNQNNKYFESTLSSLPVNVISRLNENHTLNFNQEISWELCPSLLTLTTLSVLLGKLNSLTTREAKTSDFGDILHTAYLPHVDIFRADGNTAEIIKQAKLPLKTKVVSKLTDLPIEIENLLKLKSNNYRLIK